MCIAINYRHPSCGHHATGTASNHGGPWAQLCSTALSTGTECDRFTNVENVYVSRGYCDTCIMKGAELAKAKGLDSEVYTNSMGVSLAALLEQN